MRATKEHTILMRSRTHNNLTIELELRQPRTSMSLRRRTAQRCISLPGQQTIDLCRLLEMTPDQVHDVLIRSPQVQRYAKRSLLFWEEVNAPVAPAEPEPLPTQTYNFLTHDNE